MPRSTEMFDFILPIKSRAKHFSFRSSSSRLREYHLCFSNLSFTRCQQSWKTCRREHSTFPDTNMASDRVRFITVLILSLICAYILLNINGKGMRIRKMQRLKSWLFAGYGEILTTSLVLDGFDNVNSLPGTTGPGIPKVMRSILSKKYGPVHANASSFYGAEAGMTSPSFHYYR